MKKNLTHLILCRDRAKTRQWLMRLAVLKMVLLMSLLTTYGRANSQMIISNLKLDDVELSEALERIEELTDYDFVFSYDDVQGYQVSVDLQSATLEDCLNQVFKELPFEYKAEGDVVIVSYKIPEPKIIEQQEKKTITGKVSDEKGMPLPGVSVFIKGTSIGVATDIDGNYAISFEGENTVLVFSFVGMIPQEIAYHGQTDLNVVLNYDTANLDEVVVTGYQTISRERVTGSYDKVDGIQMSKPTSNVADRLIGTIVGLHNRIGNQYDEESVLQIRGQTSLGANSAPLIVVDGFAIEGDLESINPNDIESITVLKDAAAASIWGARSANGVIVVTTKKADKGVKVEVSSWVKFEGKLNLDYANPLASGSDIVDYEEMGFNTDFFGGSSRPIENDFNKVFEDNNPNQYYSTAVIAMNENRLGFISTVDKDAALAELRTLNNKKQIEDHLLASPFTQQHNVIISGSSDKISNTLSLLFEGSNDYFKGNDSKKYNINYRNNVKLADWLDFNFSGMFQYNYVNNNGVTLNDIQAISPYDMLLNEDGSYKNVQYGLYMPLINRFVNDTGSEFPYENWGYNPIEERRSRDRNTKNIYSRIQAGLKFKILKGLTIDSKFQYEIYKTDTKDEYSENSYEVRFNVNKNTAWTIGDPNTVDPNFPEGAILDQSNSEIHAYNVRNQLSFARIFDKHSFNFIAGTEISERVAESTTFGRKYGYNSERLTFGTWPHGSSDPLNPLMDILGQKISSAPYSDDALSYLVDRYFSLYANLAYTYNDKYTISGSYRTDASNLISSDPKSRYSPFWSIGAGWQINNEDFMADLDFVDRLNLRITYGFNGNVDKSTSMDPLISYSSFSQNTGTANGTISNYGNPSLSWEKTGTFDLGIDFSLFKGKLFGKVDFYNKKGTDLISKVSLPAVNGTDSQSINAVEMYNRGVEISIGTKLPISGEDITWTGNLNLAYNKNKITSLYKDDATLNYRMYGTGSGWEYVQGYNAHTVWGLKYGGMHNFGTNENLDMRPSIVSKDGTQYRDFSVSSPASFNNADFVTDEGTYDPPITMGFTNSFKINNLDLSFIITGYFGHVFRRTGFNYPAMSGGKGNINKFYRDVVNEDPNKIVPIPTEGSSIYKNYSAYTKVLDYVTTNADNIRIEEINLTYHMSEKVLNKFGLNGLSVYAQTNNVGVIAFNKYHQDPVYAKGVIKPGISYTVGCKFNF